MNWGAIRVGDLLELMEGGMINCVMCRAGTPLLVTNEEELNNDRRMLTMILSDGTPSKLFTANGWTMIYYRRIAQYACCE